MNYSVRHCAFVISALLIGVSAIDLNTAAQARPTRQRNKPVLRLDDYSPGSAAAGIKAANEIESRKNKPVITMPIPQHIIEAAAKRAAQRKAAQGSISQQYDYLGAWNQANSAISLCYEHNNFQACNELPQIKNTLMSWCSQNDRNSCTVYKNVISAEGIAQSSQLVERVTR